MTWTDFLRDALALLAWPGGLATLAFGVVFEVLAAWSLGPGAGGPRQALARLWPGWRAAVAGSARGVVPAAVGLCLVAAVQVPAPYSPLPSSGTNLLVGASSLAAAIWLVWTWGWQRGRFAPGLGLRVQLAWILAVILPAIVPQSLHPQVIGNNALAHFLPIKFACASLYLLCLPGLLGLVPETAPQGLPGATRTEVVETPPRIFEGVRPFLWLPLTGMCAAMFFRPGGNDPWALARFVGLAAAAAALAIALAVNLVYRGGPVTQRFYGRVVVAYAAMVLFVAIALGLITAY